MAQKWKSIRIFISSTFKDMHAERDHLVLFVFPELKEKCRKHRINLIDVDLRWGVSEKDAQDGKALDICLDEIDSCRPFFLGLLGHRYGWVPLPDSIQENSAKRIDRNAKEFQLFLEAYRKDPGTDEFLLKNDDDLQEIWEENDEKNRKALIEILYTAGVPNAGHSITAREIYHGVLHNDIPEQIVDLRSIIQGKFEDQTLNNQQIECLQNCYKLDGRKDKYLLTDNPTPEELKIIRSLFQTSTTYQRDRSFFFFRSESLTKKIAGSETSDFIEKVDENKRKLNDLKREIAAQGIFTKEYDDLETFGKQVEAVLWKKIEKELDQPEGKEKDWLEEEAEFHELFMADRTRHFVGRKVLLKKMQSFCEQETEKSVLVITGEPGCGKSALMSRFTEEIIQKHPDWLIIPHFIGASPSSTNLRHTLLRLCATLNNSIDSVKKIPEDIEKLLQLFPELLAKAAQQHNILIILDAVNQFEKSDNAHAIQWLPHDLSKSVKIVASTLAGETYDALLARRDTPTVKPVHGLDQDEIKKLVHTYLQEIRHEFPDPQIEESFFSKIKKGNPLYIQVALEELRVFGQFEALANRIKRLPDDVPGLFNQVLERVESDLNPALVRDCMSYIACGRQGMTAEELQTLLADHAPPTDPQHKPDKLPDMIWARLYRAFGPYLFERSGVIDFFHGQLKEAVGKRYLHDEADRKTYHTKIGDYFEQRWEEPYIRALNELPHQRIESGNQTTIDRILTDLIFIHTKCITGMTFAVINDYEQAIDFLPEENMEPVYIFSQIFLQKTHQIYRRPELTFQLIYNEMQWQSMTVKALMETARQQFIKKGGKFLHQYRLPKTTRNNVPMTLLRYNIGSYSPDGRRIVLASKKILKILDSDSGKEIATLSGHRNDVKYGVYSPDGRHIVSTSIIGDIKVWNADSGNMITTLSECKPIITEHSDWDTKHSAWKEATSCSTATYSPDGRRIVASTGKTIKVWNADSGKEVLTLSGHRGIVKSCTFSPDSRRIVSVCNFVSTKVWDADTGKVIFTLSAPEETTHSCAYSADGRHIVSTTPDTTLKIFDANSGKKISTLSGCRTNIDTCVFSPDGRHLVTAVDVAIMKRTTAPGIKPFRRKTGEKPLLQIWDVDSGREIGTLSDGHKGTVRSIAYSPDGRHIVSASDDKTLRVWDANSGKKATTLSGHTQRVIFCAFSPNGRRIISTSSDGTFKIWTPDYCNSNKFPTLFGHKNEINSIAYSFDGRYIVSASDDDTLKVWDANSGEEITTLSGHSQGVTFCAFSPNSRHIISTSHDKTLRIWDTNSGKSITTLPKHNNLDRNFCLYSSDGRRIVSNGNFIKTWDANSGQELAIFRSSSYSENLCTFSPDGRRILSDTQGTLLKIWDANSGIEMATFSGHKKKVRNYAYSPDGRRIVSVSYDDISNHLKIWDADSGKEITTIPTLSDHIKICSFSPNGQRILSAANNNTLQIWDIYNSKKITTLPRHSGTVTYCTYSPDGHHIVTGSEDSVYSDGWELKIWDADTGKEIATFLGEENASTFELSRCGRKIAVGDPEGRLYFLKLEGFTLGPAIVTAVRQWTYGKNGDPGSLSTTITTDCPYCGDRFQIPEQILDSISSNNMSEKNFSDPTLLYNCPKCAKTMRFNPFLVHTPHGPNLQQTFMKFLQEMGISFAETSTTSSAQLRNYLLRRLFWCKKIIPNILMPFLRRLSYVIKNWNSM